MARTRPKPHFTPNDLAFGVHPCALALSQGLAKRLLYAKGNTNPRVGALITEAQSRNLPVDSVEVERLAELTGDGVHQGVLVRLHDLPTVGIPRNTTGASLALLLDGITDPQNLGAILRVAVAVGTDVVVVPPRRSTSLTPGVHRASAGLSFLAPVTVPKNLAQAVAQLKDAGYWVVAGATGADAQDATTFAWPEQTALVLGGEESGVGRLLLDASDFQVALPMDERVDSLNVSVACGALTYLWRQRWPIRT